MKKRIQKLRLQAGDVIVVSDYETAYRLQHCGYKLPAGVTNMPIVIAPEGIRRVKLSTLKTLMARLEAKEKK